MIGIPRAICSALTRLTLTNSISKPYYSRSLQTSIKLNCENIATPKEELNQEYNKELTDKELKAKLNDRTKIIPVETSIKYLQSEAYKQTYGEHLVWELYRRNHKGLFPPRKTRKTCIRQGMISTGNPCPICRDEYLVLDYRNLDLLRQFISPHTGKVLSYTTTGLCQKKHLQLLVAVERAWDYGLLVFDVPHREFDYSEYYGKDYKPSN